jgi:fibronectin type 3 domain-containing protein
VNSGLDGALNYSDTSVQNGQTYFYVTTAVDALGQESAYSSEVSALIP